MHTGKDRDVRLAVLQTIANAGWHTTSLLADLLGRPYGEIAPVLKAMTSEGLLRDDFNEDPDNPDMEYALSESGFEWFEHFDFDDAGDRGAAE
jgi:DNA-binding PadR family transcriptional regulator